MHANKHSLAHTIINFTELLRHDTNMLAFYRENKGLKYVLVELYKKYGAKSRYIHIDPGISYALNHLARVLYLNKRINNLDEKVPIEKNLESKSKLVSKKQMLTNVIDGQSNNNELPRKCSHPDCFNEETKFKKFKECSDCMGRAAYCSSKCRKDHIAHHRRIECEGHQRQFRNRMVETGKKLSKNKSPSFKQTNFEALKQPLPLPSLQEHRHIYSRRVSENLNTGTNNLMMLDRGVSEPSSCASNQPANGKKLIKFSSMNDNCRRNWFTSTSGSNVANTESEINSGANALPTSISSSNRPHYIKNSNIKETKSFNPSMRRLSSGYHNEHRPSTEISKNCEPASSMDDTNGFSKPLKTSTVLRLNDLPNKQAMLSNSPKSHAAITSEPLWTNKYQESLKIQFSTDAKPNKVSESSSASTVTSGSSLSTASYESTHSSTHEQPNSKKIKVSGNEEKTGMPRIASFLSSEPANTLSSKRRHSSAAMTNSGQFIMTTSTKIITKTRRTQTIRLMPNEKEKAVIDDWKNGQEQQTEREANENDNQSTQTQTRKAKQAKIDQLKMIELQSELLYDQQASSKNNKIEEKYDIITSDEDDDSTELNERDEYNAETTSNDEDSSDESMSDDTSDNEIKNFVQMVGQDFNEDDEIESKRKWSNRNGRLGSVRSNLKGDNQRSKIDRFENRQMFDAEMFKDDKDKYGLNYDDEVDQESFFKTMKEFEKSIEFVENASSLTKPFSTCVQHQGTNAKGVDSSAIAIAYSKQMNKLPSGSLRAPLISMSSLCNDEQSIAAFENPKVDHSSSDEDEPFEEKHDEYNVNFVPSDANNKDNRNASSKETRRSNSKNINLIINNSIDSNMLANSFEQKQIATMSTQQSAGNVQVQSTIYENIAPERHFALKKIPKSLERIYENNPDANLNEFLDDDMSVFEKENDTFKVVNYKDFKKPLMASEILHQQVESDVPLSIRPIVNSTPILTDQNSQNALNAKRKQILNSNLNLTIVPSQQSGQAKTSGMSEFPVPLMPGPRAFPETQSKQAAKENQPPDSVEIIKGVESQQIKSSTENQANMKFAFVRLGPLDLSKISALENATTTIVAMPAPLPKNEIPKEIKKCLKEELKKGIKEKSMCSIQ
jgi:hypothetical protein